MESLDVVEKAFAHGLAPVGTAEVGEGDEVDAIAHDGAKRRGIGQANHGEGGVDPKGRRGVFPDSCRLLAVHMGVKVEDWADRRPHGRGFAPIINGKAIAGTLGAGAAGNKRISS
ncbi:MAG: hypothetical protein NTV94_14975 [Planctomycetota bacterium]|nr:hypothetical protein [Planctomycetota bacterium]